MYHTYRAKRNKPYAPPRYNAPPRSNILDPSPPLTLSSKRSDPLSLEVKLKRSGSTLGLARSVTLEVSL